MLLKLLRTLRNPLAHGVAI